MNNLIASFDQIIEFAKGYGLPLVKQRAILREYLQVKILDLLYQRDVSIKIIFVGGTSLRLIRNLDRFSEDLDFDLTGISVDEVDAGVKDIFNKIKAENIEADFYFNKTKRRSYYEFRFKDLLYDLKISRDPGEKLTIKFDFESFWKGHGQETVLMNRYGYLTSVMTIDLNQHLIQKLVAYLKRKQTQPRDIYDIIWLVSQEAKPDWRFAKENGLDSGILDKVGAKFERERKKIKYFKTRLAPFLLDENAVRKLEYFPKILASLKTA